jgi:hypothetical protein
MKSTNCVSFHYIIFPILFVSPSDNCCPVLHVPTRYTRNRVIRIPVQCLISTVLVLNSAWLITTFSQMRKVKVKCTLVQALKLCTTRRWSRGKALLFHDHGTRRWWGVGVTPRPLFTPGKHPVPIVQEAGWASGPVWTGVENLAPPLHRDSVPGPSSP